MWPSVARPSRPSRAEGSGWIDAQPPGAKPLWLRTTDGPFWSAPLDDLAAVYLGLRQIGDNKAERLQTFVRRIVTAAAEQPAIERLWRYSGGDTVNLLIDRAESFSMKNESERGLPLADAAVDLAPDYAEAWSHRAYIQYRLNNYAAALGA